METSAFTQEMFGLSVRSDLSSEKVRAFFTKYAHELISFEYDQQFWTLFMGFALRAGLTSQQISDETGLSISAIDRYIEGASMPHPALAKRVVEIILDMVKEP